MDKETAARILSMDAEQIAKMLEVHQDLCRHAQLGNYQSGFFECLDCKAKIPRTD